VKALLAELEGRKLHPDEVPGEGDDEWRIAVINALRRDDPSGLWSGGGQLDPQTLLELGFDVVPLLASDLDWWALAVELNARDCALREAELALQHASVRGAALEPLLLEAVGGPDEFQTFQVAHGTSQAWTPYRSGETSVWGVSFLLLPRILTG
jgi:hypothetical protein